MLPPLMSADKLAILKQAVDQALSLVSSRKIDLTVNELARHLSIAFDAGERDPAKLAEAALSCRTSGASH